MNGVTKTKIARVRNDGRWHSRGSDWSTPQELFNKLNAEFKFTLDVCASDWNAKCEKYFTEEQDALKQDWGNNICWMNPPYGKVLMQWIEKAFQSSLNGADVVCLVPSATDLEWWHKFAMKGEIKFIRSRPRFVTKEGKWQQTFSPSTIVIFRHADLKTQAKSKISSFNMGLEVQKSKISSPKLSPTEITSPNPNIQRLHPNLNFCSQRL